MAAVMRTDVGRVRRQNEDSAWLDERRGLFAVADGMGGHLAGEVASAMAIDAIRRLAEREAKPDIAVLRDVIEEAHDAIASHAQENIQCYGMGTTLSVLWRAKRTMVIAHVGDSRIYRLRGGRMAQITQDHSLVAELVRGHLLTEEEARVHPQRNVITRALGAPGDNPPDLFTVDRKRGDLWMLCSDGLSSMVSDDEMERVLKSERDVEKAADALIAMALDAGGHDNVTLILYRDGEA